MTIREFYQSIGANYDIVLKRLLKESLIRKYLTMFLEDKTYDELKKALHDQQGEAAFRHAHTLKGLCLNLELTNISPDIVRLTDDLRGYDINDHVLEEFKEFSVLFEQLCQQIQMVINEDEK